MENIVKKYNVKSEEQINKGWSGDQKSILFCENGEKLLLRTSAPDKEEKREIQFYYLKALDQLDINMAKVIEHGVLKNGKPFTLFSFIEGQSLEGYVSSLTDEQSYNLGEEAGAILKKIHLVKPHFHTFSWFAKYKPKFLYKISKYKECPLKYEKGEFLIDYYEQNLNLMKDRPLVFNHGDYHVGNMVIDGEKLGIIDFDKVAIADPYDDLKPYCWNVFESEYFASGLINGYFNNQIPNDFFPILKYYTVESLISHLPWARGFGQKDVENAYMVYDFSMKWYDNFNLTIPTWYKKVK